MSNTQPDAIDEVLSKLNIGQRDASQLGRATTIIFVDGKDEAKAALSAMVAEIIGEDEPTVQNYIGHNRQFETLRNNLKDVQRQRATALGLNFKEDK